MQGSGDVNSRGIVFYREVREYQLSATADGGIGNGSQPASRNRDVQDRHQGNLGIDRRPQREHAADDHVSIDRHQAPEGEVWNHGSQRRSPRRGAVRSPRLAFKTAEKTTSTQARNPMEGK